MKRISLGQIATSAAILVGTVALLRPALASVAAEESDLVHTKSLALATLMYSGDADDRFPMALAPTPGGGWRMDARFITKGRMYDEPFHWASAIYPYIKNASSYEAVGAPRLAVREGADLKLPGVGHSYNGLLNSYDAAAVETPSGTVMFTQSYGFVNIEGWAVSNPEMTCTPNYPCRYVPAQAGCGGTEAGTTSRLRSADAAQYGEKEPKDGYAHAQAYARVDGSAKVIHFDKATSTTPFPVGEFFWSRLDKEGKATNVWTDAHGCHPLRFRPDYKPEDDATAREAAK